MKQYKEIAAAMTTCKCFTPYFSGVDPVDPFHVKHNINFDDWFGSYNAINGCINQFITQFVDCPQYAYTVKELCYFRDYVDPFVLISTEIVQLIEYVCTIYRN